MSYSAEKKAHEVLRDLGFSEEEAEPGGGSNVWLAKILSDAVEAGRGERREDELRKVFDGQLDMFKRTGDPMVFGRLEAYKEVAEIFGYTDLVKHIEKEAKVLTELRLQGKL